MQPHRNHYTKTAPTTRRAARSTPKPGEDALPPVAPLVIVETVVPCVEVGLDPSAVVLAVVPAVVAVLGVEVAPLPVPVVAGGLPDTATTSDPEPALRQYW
jgi:hypothetical protein